MLYKWYLNKAVLKGGGGVGHFSIRLQKYSGFHFAQPLLLSHLLADRTLLPCCELSQKEGHLARS